jgi:aquaporin rerated protein, other eukaryote
LFLVGAVPAIRSIVVFLAQIVGGIAAAAVVYGLLPGSLTINVSLGGGTSIVRGLFIEMFTTCQLTFAVIMLAAVKHKATYLAPIGIGLALFIGHLFSKSASFNMCNTPLTVERHLLHGSRHQPGSSLRSSCSHR